MNALILVGGEGTRLRPLTYDTPKPMLPIVNRPIIARIVEWLRRYDVERAVLSLGYRPDAFVEAFPENEWDGVSLSYAIEPQPLDTAGAIRFAAQSAELMDEPIVIVNGDILTDLDLSELIGFHHDRGGMATIALTPVSDPSAFGVVPIDDNGQVIAFVEKPPPGKAPTNLINVGTYVFEPEVLQRIDSTRRVSVEREIFPALVVERELFAMASKTYWIDTGSPDRYLQAQLDVLMGLRPQVLFPEHTELSAGIRLASGASCAGRLAGVAFIGRDSRIDEGAIVTDCVIGNGCVIGAGSQVRRSLILDGAQIGANVRCENSIVGARARIGDSATLRDLSVVGNSAEIAPQAHLDSARVPV